SMHPVGDFFARRGPALLDDATECRLDVPSRAAEPVIEIEVAESGVEIVAPEQAYDFAAEPEAFGIGGRAAQHLFGLGIFVDLLLGVLAVARWRLFPGLLVGGL